MCTEFILCSIFGMHIAHLTEILSHPIMQESRFHMIYLYLSIHEGPLMLALFANKLSMVFQSPKELYQHQT